MMSIPRNLPSRLLIALSRGMSGLVFGLVATLFGRHPELHIAGHPPTWLLVTALVTGIAIAVVTLYRATSD